MDPEDESQYSEPDEEENVIVNLDFLNIDIENSEINKLVATENAIVSQVNQFEWFSQKEGLRMSAQIEVLRDALLRNSVQEETKD